VRRIGALIGGRDESDPWWKRRISAFTQALADLGWTDGRNLQMDLRWYGGDINRIRALAHELVGLKPDIILTETTPATVDGVAHVCKDDRDYPRLRASIGIVAVQIKRFDHNVARGPQSLSSVSTILSILVHPKAQIAPVPILLTAGSRWWNPQFKLNGTPLLNMKGAACCSPDVSLETPWRVSRR
jgi:hypothetical protein